MRVFDINYISLKIDMLIYLKKWAVFSQPLLIVMRNVDIYVNPVMRNFSDSELNAGVGESF